MDISYFKKKTLRDAQPPATIYFESLSLLMLIELRNPLVKTRSFFTRYTFTDFGRFLDVQL